MEMDQAKTLALADLRLTKATSSHPSVYHLWQALGSVLEGTTLAHRRAPNSGIPSQRITCRCRASTAWYRFRIVSGRLR
jgi:hypothetical protein